MFFPAMFFPAQPADLVKPVPIHNPPAIHRPVPPRPAHFRFYDSVVPSAVPKGKHIAVYINGAYAAGKSETQGHRVIARIDVNGTNPGTANTRDLEPGNGGPDQAGPWAKERLRHHPHSQVIIYTMKSWWTPAKASIRTHVAKSERAHIKWWIADPTGKEHMVAGADATQWYWGKTFDINTAKEGFGK